MIDGPSEPQSSGPIDQSRRGESGQPSEPSQPSQPSQPSRSSGPFGAGGVASAPQRDQQDAAPNTPEGLTHNSPEASPAPPPARDDYQVGNLVGWAVLAFLLLWPLMFLGQAVAAVGFPVASVAAGIAVGILPIVWAALMFRRAANKSAASPWLGILIGSALFLVIFSGSCVTLLLTFTV